jgi:hypothetical protein
MEVVLGDPRVRCRMLRMRDSGEHAAGEVVVAVHRDFGILGSALRAVPVGDPPAWPRQPFGKRPLVDGCLNGRSSTCSVRQPCPPQIVTGCGGVSSGQQASMH